MEYQYADSWGDPRSSGSTDEGSGLLFGPGEYEFLENTLDCVYLLDRQWRFQYLNRKARGEIANGKNLSGRVLWDEFPEVRGTIFEESYRRAMLDRVNADFETYFPPL